MQKTRLSICLILPILAGCHAKVTGNLQVDGATFGVEQCRSGQAFGFSGIELTDASGRRLRLLARADGTCTAALFSGATATGDPLGGCGVLTMATQSSRINSINNLEGNARLSCESGSHKVAGNIEFKNCH